jgi:hypothetical protein
MEKNSVIKRLRDGEPLQLYRDGLFIKLQLNNRNNRICWERWVSKDKRSWMNWNLFLSLREVLQIYNDNEKREIN